MVEADAGGFRCHIHTNPFITGFVGRNGLLDVGNGETAELLEMAAPGCVICGARIPESRLSVGQRYTTLRTYSAEASARGSQAIVLPIKHILRGAL